MPFIYKITNNIDGTSYIGKTTYTIDKRWKQHLSNSKLDHLKHLKLYAAMNEFGLENFTVSLVESVSNIHNLNDREKYWVQVFDTYYNGYNETRGGGGSLIYDYDMIWELWNDGYTIKEISNIMQCNDFVVRTCLTANNVSTDDRILRSIDNQILSNAIHSRKVEQRDINTNDIICVYHSVGEASRELGCDSSYLSKVCRNSGITHGYRWTYANKRYVRKDFSAREVVQYDLISGKTICVYPSLSKAAESVSGDASYISKVCYGKQRSSKGFGWRFATQADSAK